MKLPAKGVGRRAFRLPAPLVLLAPFVGLFVLFYVVPIIWALRMSMYADRLIGGETFVGLDSYSRALHDPSIRTGLAHVGFLGFVQVPLTLLAALILALVLDGRALRARGLFRVGIFLPFAVPTVVAGLMWGFMYDDRLGPFGRIGDAIGVDTPNFLARAWALPAIGNIVLWGTTGVGMVIIYTALKAIPTDVLEAAALDGRRPWQIVREIKVPLVRPVLLLLLLLVAIAMLQLFNEPYILNQLAPDAVSRDFAPNLYAYTLAFNGNEISYGAAISLVLAAMVMIASGIALVAARLRDEPR